MLNPNMSFSNIFEKVEKYSLIELFNSLKKIEKYELIQ